jgi:hypothetical protein
MLLVGRGIGKKEKGKGVAGVGGGGERVFLLNSTIYTVRNIC